MGRKSLKEIRRKEIIKGFYKVAKKEGLENTSIAKVATYMQINPSLIMHYFKTRDEILLAFNDYILLRYRAIYNFPNSNFETRKELLELIERLFSRKWDRLISDGVFYSCYAMTYQNKKLKKRFKAMHDTLRQLLREALEKACNNGIINCDNIEELSEKIHILLEGTYYYLGMVDEETETENKMKMVKKQVLDMLNLEVVKPRASTGLEYISE